MAHFIYGFLHELDNYDTLSGNDAALYAEWIARLVKSRFHAKLDVWNPLIVVGRHGQTLSFPPADDLDAGFLRFVDTITESSGESWAAALRAATFIVAEEMRLHGAATAVGEPNEANNRLLSTPRDIIIRDISHEVPTRIATAYQSCVDRPCGGHPTGEDDWRDLRRTDLAALYECFLRSYIPPFTSDAFKWYRPYRCLDIREVAFRHECKPGDESSPYGDVVITFAHVNE